MDVQTLCEETNGESSWDTPLRIILLTEYRMPCEFMYTKLKIAFLTDEMADVSRNSRIHRERKWWSELILRKICLRVSSPRVLDRKHGRKVCLPHTSYPFHHHVSRSPVVYSRHDGPGKNLENCNFTTIDRDAYFTFRVDPNSRLMYGYRRRTIANALPHRGYVTTDQEWTFGFTFSIAERKNVTCYTVIFRDKSIRVVIIFKSQRIMNNSYVRPFCRLSVNSPFCRIKWQRRQCKKRKREEEKWSTRDRISVIGETRRFGRRIDRGPFLGDRSGWHVAAVIGSAYTNRYTRQDATT